MKNHYRIISGEQFFQSCNAKYSYWTPFKSEAALIVGHTEAIGVIAAIARTGSMQVTHLRLQKVDPINFTPRLKGSERRLGISLSQDELHKILRGHGWRATVTDLSGRTWNVNAAPCGVLSCFCDAIVERV